MSIASRLGKKVPMSIYAVLSEEHREVDMLMKGLKKLPERLERAREGGVEKLRAEIISHAHTEQNLVYRRLLEKSSDPEIVEHAIEDHQRMEQLVTLLTTLEMDTAEWEQTLDELQATVERHVDEEENILFEQLRAILSEDEAKEIAKEFIAAKQQEMESIKT